MIAWLAGCTPPPVEIDGPALVQPTLVAPYARLIRWGFDRGVVVSMHATDGEHDLDRTAGPARSFELPLIGLYPDRTWTVELEARADGDVVSEHEFEFATVPLPAPFPQEEVRVADPERMEPGLTLIPLSHAITACWLVALDAEGEVAWLYDSTSAAIMEAHPFERPDGGGGVRMLQGGELAEIDWYGRDLRRWKGEYFDDAGEAPASPIPGANAFSHELAEAPDGNWLTIDRESRTIASYPLSYDDRRPRRDQLVGGDAIEEIDPDRGVITRRWSLFDHLDTRRIGYGSLDPSEAGADWSHVNALSARGDEILASARHQDAVFLVDRWGDLDFVMGNPDNWSPDFRPLLLEPVGRPFDWFYHQHGVKWLDGDRVLMFDNGNFRASPWTPEPKVANVDNRSRVVEYRVDRAARTVSQDWSFLLDPPVYSGAMGDADELPGGHVLATYAFVLFEGRVANEDAGRQDPSVRLVEFDPATREVVWDVDLWADADEPGPSTGWTAFRAERFRGF